MSGPRGPGNGTGDVGWRRLRQEPAVQECLSDPGVVVVLGSLGFWSDGVTLRCALIAECHAKQAFEVKLR